MALRELLLELDIKVDKKGAQKADKTLKNITRAAKAVGAFFAAGILARGARNLLGVASDFEETTNVINESFGKSAEAVENWAVRQSKALGRSRSDLREMAGELGSLLNPAMEGNTEAAADMATQLSQLAVDLGSFFNKSEPEVLLALRAGLVGSTEPLLKFGVNLQVAQVEAFALEKGITKSFKSMSNAEKTALRFQLIMAKTANAQGDAAKTAGGFANMIKRLAGVFKDAAVELGKEFLPAMEDLLKVLVPIIKAIGGGLIRAVKAVRVGFQLASDAISRINQTMGVTGVVLAGLLSVFVALRTAMFLFGNAALVAAAKTLVGWIIAAAPFFIIIGVIALVSAAIFALLDDFRAFQEGGDSIIGLFADEWLDAWNKITKAIDRAFSSLDGFVDLLRDLKDAATALPGFIQESVFGDATAENDQANRFRKLGGELSVSRLGGEVSARRAANAANRQVSNSNRTDIKVEVDARGATDPSAVGASVGDATGAASDASLRRAAKRFQTERL